MIDGGEQLCNFPDDVELVNGNISSFIVRFCEANGNRQNMLGKTPNVIKNLVLRLVTLIESRDSPLEERSRFIVVVINCFCNILGRCLQTDLHNAFTLFTCLTVEQALALVVQLFPSINTIGVAIKDEETAELVSKALYFVVTVTNAANALQNDSSHRTLISAGMKWDHDINNFGNHSFCCVLLQ